MAGLIPLKSYYCSKQKEKRIFIFLPKQKAAKILTMFLVPRINLYTELRSKKYPAVLSFYKRVVCSDQKMLSTSYRPLAKLQSVFILNY